VNLTPRQRASWCAHLYKAAARRHHRALEPLFARHLPPDGVVLDIGAHAGQFAKLFARLAPQGMVHAFEPSAYARSILVPALRLNRLANVAVHPLALSDAPGALVLHTPLKRSSALGFGLAHLGEADAPGLDQTVEVTTLDAWAAANPLPRLDLVKIDIEGWEPRALRGGRATLARFTPALYLEVDDGHLARAGETPDGLFAWLAALGYCPFDGRDGAPVAAWRGPGDYLFVHAGRADRRPDDVL